MLLRSGLRQFRTLLFLCALIAAIVISGCAGIGDFEFDVCGGYKLTRSSAHAITIVKQGVGYQAGKYIPAKVVELAWDEQFVIAKQVAIINTPDKGSRPDETTVGYWILDTAIHTAYGPYTLEAFEKNKQALGVSPGIVLKSVQSYPKKK
jgi:hypothetical protein